MLPNLGASGSQFEDLLVPNFWGPMLPNLGTTGMQF